MNQIKIIENPKGTYSCELDVTVEEWIQILSDKNFMTQNYKNALMAFYNEPGHKSTCKDLSLKYYVNIKNAQKYNSLITQFGQAVVKRLDRFHIIDTDGSERFWPVAINPGKLLDNGLFEWTLRKELVMALKEVSWDKQFTWIPFYEELADKLLAYKDNRKELVAIAYESGNADYIKGADGGKVNDIDPFTFLGIFNRKLKTENRIKIAAFFKEKFEMEADVPTDFDGIPIVDNRNSSFCWGDKIATETQHFWDLFEAAIMEDRENLRTQFDEIQKQDGIKWNITMGLYWIRPNDYISLDSKNQKYLDKLGIKVFDEKHLDGAHYLDILDTVRQKLSNRELKEKSIPEISYNAWRSDCSTIYWLVGCSFDGINSQKERFVKEGIWEGGFDKNKAYDKELLKLVETFKEGDVLILKSTGTKGSKHDQPFMRVKAVGVITSPIEKREYVGHVLCTCKVNYVNAIDKDFDGSIYGGYQSTVHVANKGKIPDVISYVKSILGDEIMVDNKYEEYINLLKANYNLVLNGAPGTGKTRMAIEIAKAMGCGKDEMEFVQFHPSYDYTDFVEGLRPKEDATGNIGFERKDGVFKKFCQAAIQNIKDSSTETVKEKPFVFIIDEINRGEVSKILGELFFAIDPGYRGKTDVKVMTQYQNLIKDNEPFHDGFYVPKNVYIIGTMNDIDRSVESMDFAMRRRFTWKEVAPEDTQDMLDCLDQADKAKECMNRLNKCIKETDGLGPAFQIGAAYFLKLKDNGGNFEALWKMNIEPLLREYIRGFRHVEETMGKFKDAYDGKQDSQKVTDSEDLFKE